MSEISAAIKIKSFEQLPNGWHYGSGKAPDKITVISALYYNNMFSQYSYTTNAFVGENGEIMVTAYPYNFYIEVSIEADGLRSFRLEQNNFPKTETIIDLENLSHLAAFNEIEKAKAYISENILCREF